MDIIETQNYLPRSFYPLKTLMSVIKVAFGFKQLKQLTTHSDITTSLHAHVY